MAASGRFAATCVSVHTMHIAIPPLRERGEDVES
jgi:DNA-binding NtrC family response regulator